MQTLVTNIEIPIPILLTKVNALIIKEKDTIHYQDNLQLQDFTVTELSDTEVIQDGFNYSLALKFNLKKDAGLFSIEGNGTIKVKCCCMLSFDNNFNTHVKTTLIDHEWIQKPIIKMGVFELSVQTIGNLIIDHYKENMLTAMDKSIAQSLNIKTLYDTFVKPYANTLVYKNPNVYLNVTSDHIHIHTADIVANTVQIKVAIKHLISLADIPEPIDNQYPLFVLNNTTPKEDNALMCLAKATFTTLGKTLTTALNQQKVNDTNLDITELMIQHTDKLHILARVAKPLKGDLSISGNVLFDANAQTLKLEGQNVDVKPSNFIYSLLSPVIESVISNKIEAMFPIQIKDMLQSQINKFNTGSHTFPFGEIIIENGEIVTNEFNFENDRITGQFIVPIRSLTVRIQKL